MGRRPANYVRYLSSFTQAVEEILLTGDCCQRLECCVWRGEDVVVLHDQWSGQVIDRHGTGKGLKGKESARHHHRGRNNHPQQVGPDGRNPQEIGSHRLLRVGGHGTKRQGHLRTSRDLLPLVFPWEIPLFNIQRATYLVGMTSLAGTRVVNEFHTE